MLRAEDARRALKDAEREYIEVARERFGPTGETREARERYEEKLAALVAATDQAKLVGVA